ncbi:Variant-specific surface protein, partial [Giardia duodenalis]
VLLAIYLAVGALAADCTGGAANNCAQGKCEMVGTAEICTECTVNGGKGYVPINGICKAHDDTTVVTGTGAGCQKTGGTAVDENSVICEKCTEANYFLFMGGCYSKDGSPGSLVCTAVSAGKCDTCKADGNVFPNQAAQKTLGSECILCSETTGADGNLGVENCLTCTAPIAATGTAACTKCDQTKYLKEGVCVDSTACTGTTFPKADTGAGNKCVSCGSTGSDGGIADCQACTKESTTLKCLTCNSDKKPSTDGTKCVTCTVTNCATCSADNICEVCTDGYRKNGSNCEKCTVDECKACTNDAKVCTECVTGYAPSADGSSCASSSTNKSALSTGAIAGISVAVIAVVGGLVGFLCWWFICRGKA